MFKYLGVDAEEINFNQPKGMLYKTENPFEMCIRDRYEPFSSADTLVYTAPDGWDARSVADMGDGRICVMLMSKSNAQAHKLVMAEIE